MKPLPALTVCFPCLVAAALAIQAGTPENTGIGTVRFFVDPATNSDDPERRMAYGLNITPPWPDGGSIFVNLPEHLEYMPGTRGIARHHDSRANVWRVSADQLAAGYDVESLTEPGVFFAAKARSAGERVELELTITNRSSKTLRSIRPLLCFQYHSLKGFPAANTDNFAHTFVVVGGKAASLASLPVKNHSARARMAQVKGCADEHNAWAEEMGGFIGERLDAASTVLTATKDDRKVAVHWTPGKNLLSNTAIPCIHADPCFGDLAPGEARTVRGKVLFTRAPLEQLVADLAAEDAGPSRSNSPAGLAAKHPGDAGIEQDPAVLFAENFETGSLDDLTKRWTESSNKGGKVFAWSEETPPGSAGKRSFQTTATRGENTGGHLYKRLPRGVDRLFARFYVKFAPDDDYTHHFAALGGYNPPTNWPQGGAGERPRGDDRIYVGIEPTDLHGRVPPPGAWMFYNYWHEMKVSADGKFWGQGIAPETPLFVPKDRWQCVEVMVQLNSAPDKSDGELAFWLDGEKVLNVSRGTPRGPWTGMGFKVKKDGGEPFEGFRWRTSRDLQLNYFWLLHYVTDDSYRSAKTHRVRFDDVVVATEYIGPIQR